MSFSCSEARIVFFGDDVGSRLRKLVELGFGELDQRRELLVRATEQQVTELRLLRLVVDPDRLERTASNCSSGDRFSRSS